MSKMVLRTLNTIFSDVPICGSYSLLRFSLYLFEVDKQSDNSEVIPFDYCYDLRFVKQSDNNEVGPYVVVGTSRVGN